MGASDWMSARKAAQNHIASSAFFHQAIASLREKRIRRQNLGRDWIIGFFANLFIRRCRRPMFLAMKGLLAEWFRGVEVIAEA